MAPDEPLDSDHVDQSPPDRDSTELARVSFGDSVAIRWSLLIIAATAVVAFLSFARVILVPIVLAIFLSYILFPPVRMLTKLRLPGTELYFPRIAAVLLVVLLTVVSTGALALLLGDQVRRLGAELPRYRNRVARSVAAVQNRVRSVRDHFQRFLQPIRDRIEADDEDSSETDEASEENSPETDETSEEKSSKTDRVSKEDTSPSTNTSPSSESPMPPPPPRPRPPPTSPSPPGPDWVQRGTEMLMNLSSSLTGGLSGIFGALAQILTGIFVLFFTLLEAPAFKTKLLNILGTTDARREAILDVLRDINRDIQGYLFGRFVINTVLALVVAFVFFVYGLNYALLVGIFAGLLNFIPYLGAVIGMFIPALIAYMQFGTFSAVTWSAFIYLMMTGVEGNLITPLVLGRHLQLNSLAILLGLIFWGWVWGTIGMLLAIPILATSRVVAEHVEGLEPVAELLRG